MTSTSSRVRSFNVNSIEGRTGAGLGAKYPGLARTRSVGSLTATPILRHVPSTFWFFGT